jgi:hypothetical protein
VDHSLGVAVGQGIQQLTGPLQHLGLRERPPGGNQVGQTLPLHEVHHQVGIAALFKVVGHPDQVEVVQAGQDLGLLVELVAELGQGVGVNAGLGDHLLEGDGDVEAQVPGPVDGAHPALAQEGQDAVAVLQGLPHSSHQSSSLGGGGADTTAHATIIPVRSIHAEKRTLRFFIPHLADSSGRQPEPLNLVVHALPLRAT